MIDAYNDTLRHSDWLDTATAARALEKLGLIHYDKIGYPDALRNDSLIDSIYSLVDVQGMVYHALMLSIVVLLN